MLIQVVVYLMNSHMTRAIWMFIAFVFQINAAWLYNGMFYGYSNKLKNAVRAPVWGLLATTAKYLMIIRYGYLNNAADNSHTNHTSKNHDADVGSIIEDEGAALIGWAFTTVWWLYVMAVATRLQN